MTADIVDYRILDDGEVLFREGDRAGEAYILKSGAARITRKVGGQEKELGLRTPKTIIGEMGVIADMPRLATATAVGETVCFVITRGLFNRLLDNADVETRSMIYFMVHFIRDAELGEAKSDAYQPLEKRARIIRHFAKSDETGELLAHGEPLFVTLCRALLERALDTMETAGLASTSA